MDVILGIDLGTTNSEVAVVQNGRPVILLDDGDPILPSVVGLDPQGKLLVGRAARNQFVLAPERTIRSVKRQMGEATPLTLGEQKYTPQEVSAMILRALKARAEKALGRPVTKAVVTVPAFFNDAQREATREAGTLAGLEVVRIINEPTAAVLTYDAEPPEMERLLVYDLGGGTFDVSIAQVERGVVEILASHGDTHLGGDDFDERLLNQVCDDFQTEHGIDLRASLHARSRLLAAVEQAKMRLSSEPLTTIVEEFIAERDGVPLHLQLEISRSDYEDLIRPLVARTLKCADDALRDARLSGDDIAKVLLVGGATRTPLVQQMLADHLGQPVHAEIEPDLAVALGAAVQGALIAGVEVGPVLVDITPHSLGIEIRGHRDGFELPHTFSAIIPRNTPLPATRTELYFTCYDNQASAKIMIFQGEEDDTRHNSLVGGFEIQGLSKVPAPNEILVRLDLDLSGILRVTAIEKDTNLAKQVTIDNMMERFRKRSRAGAIERLEELFEASPELQDFSEMEEDDDSGSAEQLDPALQAALAASQELIAKAVRAEGAAAVADASELKGLVADLRAAAERRSVADMQRILPELEDLVFYLSDR